MLKTWHLAAFDGLEFVQSAGITQALPPHFHEGYSIGLATHGVQRLHTEAQSLLAGPGSLLLASPYQVLAHAPLPGTEWAHKMLHVSPDAICYLQRQGYIPRQHALTFAAPVADFPAWAARYEALHQQAGSLSEVALNSPKFELNLLLSSQEVLSNTTGQIAKFTSSVMAGVTAVTV